MASKLLTSAKDYFLELLFPVKCAACEKETGDRPKNKLICTDCLKNLAPSLNFFCPLCEARTAGGELCFSCRLIISNTENKFELNRLLYPFSYKDRAVQKIIKAFKYRFIKGLEEPLGRLMIRYLEKLEDKVELNLNESVIIPVPLHKRKFNQRGYNQSVLIAEKIFKYLAPRQAELAADALVKIKMTKDQARLKEGQRPGNLKGVFACSKPWLVSGKKILLFDDVYTTGATMAECARVLKEAGAREIVGLAIARG
ncbi:MAG: ComF family protein [Parcubacteria group bacterium]|nr:ComF family protein [Parcubacteria group bacterium]